MFADKSDVHCKVGSWSYPLKLDWAVNACQGKTFLSYGRKKFFNLLPCGLDYKGFMTVNYDHKVNFSLQLIL